MGGWLHEGLPPRCGAGPHHGRVAPPKACQVPPVAKWVFAPIRGSMAHFASVPHESKPFAPPTRPRPPRVFPNPLCALCGLCVPTPSFVCGWIGLLAQRLLTAATGAGHRPRPMALAIEYSLEYLTKNHRYPSIVWIMGRRGCKATGGDEDRLARYMGVVARGLDIETPLLKLHFSKGYGNFCENLG